MAVVCSIVFWVQLVTAFPLFQEKMGFTAEWSFNKEKNLINIKYFYLWFYVAVFYYYLYSFIFRFLFWFSLVGFGIDIFFKVTISQFSDNRKQGKT